LFTKAYLCQENRTHLQICKYSNLKKDMTSFFTSGPLSPPNPTVKRLLSMIKRESNAQRTEKARKCVRAGVTIEYLQDDKWEDKAVRSLAKKLKKCNLLDELERAIVNEDINSGCIAIPR
jgi:hypothetical protein